MSAPLWRRERGEYGPRFVLSVDDDDIGYVLAAAGGGLIAIYSPPGCAADNQAQPFTEVKAAMAFVEKHALAACAKGGAS